MSPRADEMFSEACALRDNGDVQGAILKFREALKEDPAPAGAWACLGQLLADCGELPEAIDCLRRATEIEPKRDVFAVGLYFALLDAAQYEEARAEAVRFMTLVKTAAATCADDIRNDLEAMVDYPEKVIELHRGARN